MMSTCFHVFVYRHSCYFSFQLFLPWKCTLSSPYPDITLPSDREVRKVEGNNTALVKEWQSIQKGRSRTADHKKANFEALTESEEQFLKVLLPERERHFNDFMIKFDALVWLQMESKDDEDKLSEEYQRRFRDEKLSATQAVACIEQALAGSQHREATAGQVPNGPEAERKRGRSGTRTLSKTDSRNRLRDCSRRNSLAGSKTVVRNASFSEFSTSS